MTKASDERFVKDAWNAGVYEKKPVTTTDLRQLMVEYSQGTYFIWLVWALFPGRPQIVAICTSEAEAERRLNDSSRIASGAKMYKERVPLDHDFGRKDIQSIIYRSATRRSL